ncbi:AAA ATPase-like protein [Humibacillus xanthopallidus]|uniref:AAA ATPase-like protein n=1 Tax=Humibacillus xanthopallidus TaxID=412689 RepID=A0A543PTT2_9MICO|nr:ATP-binding protein [Humibacillus xanthopallidus]TQN47456.1 AAA ATPase-like protein [Humibacillus xanthopallidus]
MSSTLGDRIAAAQRKGFVGRADELARFTDIVTATDMPVVVVFVHGPGGCGKTALLRQFAHVSRTAGATVTSVDARELPPVAEALASALSPDGLPAPGSRSVILVDSFELMAPLEGVLRDQLLPALPADSLVVLASQRPPGPGWLADPGWSQLISVFALGNLSPAESNAFLAARGIPDDRRAPVVRFTGGHPLALALVAETLLNRGDFDPSGSPDVIGTLVEQFVQVVPSPRHRRALEACALVRQLTEPLLAALLGEPADGAEAAAQFDWLRRLPCVDHGRAGLYLNDLAKAVIAADLQWRDPDLFTEMHRLARQYYLDRLAVASTSDHAALLMDLMFLHPELRPFLRPADATAAGALSTRPANPSDREPIVEMVRRHEGPESADHALHWLETAPQAWQVVSDATDLVVGALCLLRVQPDDGGDPAMASARRELTNHPPLRTGEEATLIRFWMARDTYQDVSPVQSLIAVQLGRHYLSVPGPALTLLPFANQDAWAEFAAYADQTPMPDADFEVGGRWYAVHGHDWRVVTPTQWLSVLAQREVGSHPEVPPSAHLHVMPREDFALGVRNALRELTRPDRLRASALLGTRVVTARAPASASPRDLVTALQQVVLEAVEENLKTSTNQNDRRAYRMLHRTYVQPAPTLERAAEALGLPSSTFRRHLTAAVDRLTEILWNQEIGSDSPAL